MKTKKDLFELLANVTLVGKDKFFFNWSGHINELSVTYYQAGWQLHKDTDTLNLRQECSICIDSEERIQEMYWFLYNRLNK